MEVSKTSEKDKDMIYQLTRVDNGELYYDPGRHVDRDEDKWWFTGHELKDEGAWQIRARRRRRDSCILS